MFGACCCVDNTDANQITTQFSTTEENGPLPASANAVLVQQDSPLVTAPAVEQSGGGGSDLAYSARSLTAEQKEAEKSRLQALVNSFAKKAVKGCMCVYLKESTGEQCATQYRIDKSLEYLIVVCNQDAARAEVTCPIAAIQDIYSLAEDGEGCFPADVVAKLTPEEQKLLLMVVYRNGESKMFRFCLLEESPESRDTFLECLRILCIYAQSAPQTSTWSQGAAAAGPAPAG